MQTSLSIILQTPGALPPLVWGWPGSAKSQMIQALAKHLDWPCEVLCPGERGEGAFGVVPVPSEDGYLHYPPPEWVRRFKTGDGLVFIDEINTAPPALQPALLGLALDRRIGGHTLRPEIRRIAAANPPEQAAGGWDLAPALANRFVHLDWPGPSSNEWSDWLLGETSAPNYPRINSKEWAKEFIAARILTAGFHRKKPGQLAEDPAKALTGRFPPAFASPRSWECAARLLASCRVLQNLDLFVPLAEGCLGPAIAGEWLHWLRTNDLPDPEELLAKGAPWQPDKTRPDQAFVAALAVAEAATQRNGFTWEQRDDRWNRAWVVLGGIAKIDKGLIVPAGCRLMKHRAETTAAAAQEVINSLSGLLKAAIQ